jgi:hypothetical protein
VGSPQEVEEKGGQEGVPPWPPRTVACLVTEGLVTQSTISSPLGVEILRIVMAEVVWTFGDRGC